MSTDRYIDNVIEPKFEASCDTYPIAAEEMLYPMPSTPVKRWPKFSTLVGGFRPKEFTILCGATGVGKTTLLANWCIDWAEQGVPTFIASVETGRTDFVKRMMSAWMGRDLNTGEQVGVEVLKNFQARYGQFLQAGKTYLSLFENRFSVERLMHEIAWQVKHHGVKVAMIDNLNFFLEVTKSADQIVEMDRVIHELIIFCKTVDVHIIMVMHPKKTDHGRVESEFDIKGSSTAVQEAHNVILFNRPSEDLIEADVAAPFDREIKIAKMRRKGRSVGNRIVLRGVEGVLYEEGGVYASTFSGSNQRNRS